MKPAALALALVAAGLLAGCAGPDVPMDTDPLPTPPPPRDYQDCPDPPEDCYSQVSAGLSAAQLGEARIGHFMVHATAYMWPDPVPSSSDPSRLVFEGGLALEVSWLPSAERPFAPLFLGDGTMQVAPATTLPGITFLRDQAMWAFDDATPYPHHEVFPFVSDSLVPAGATFTADYLEQADILYEASDRQTISVRP